MLPKSCKCQAGTQLQLLVLHRGFPCVTEVTHIIKQLQECSLYFYIISLLNLSPDPWSSALSSGGSFVTQLCEVPASLGLVQAVACSKMAKR